MGRGNFKTTRETVRGGARVKKYTDVYEYKVLSYKDYLKLRRVRKWKNVWVVVKPNEIDENKTVEVRRLKECLT